MGSERSNDSAPGAGEAVDRERRSTDAPQEIPSWLHGQRGWLLMVGIAAVVAVPLTALLAFYQPFSWTLYRNVLFVGLCYGSGYLVACDWAMPRLQGRAHSRYGHLLYGIASLVLAIVIGGSLNEWVSGWVGYSTSQHWWVGSGILVAVRIFHLDYDRLLHRAKEVELQEERLRHQAARAELAALQARVDPHFLFNSLNTVAGLIEEDPERAVHVVTRLAGLYQRALQASRCEAVSLSSELQSCDAYLEIQSLRFGERLSYEIEQPSHLNADALAVPPLCLQILAENAVLHGSSGGEACHVRVSVQEVGKRLVLKVEDNGPGPGLSLHRGNGTALADLEQRLSRQGGQASLQVGARPGGGFEACIELPLRYEAAA